MSKITLFKQFKDRSRFNKRQKWEDHWDDVFKEILKGWVIKDFSTFNDYAKNYIKSLIAKEIDLFIKRHNLITIKAERSEAYKHYLKNEKRNLKKIIDNLEYYKKEADEIIKQITN